MYQTFPQVCSLAFVVNEKKTVNKCTIKFDFYQNISILLSQNKNNYWVFMLYKYTAIQQVFIIKGKSKVAIASD